MDVLAHKFLAEVIGLWNKSLPVLMSKSNVALIPTLKLFRIDLERPGLPIPIINLIAKNAIEQTAAVYKAGVEILFGTEIGYLHDYDSTEEFQLMEKAGMGYKAVLRSLMIGPSQKIWIGF